jgi:hypothetical protein
VGYRDGMTDQYKIYFNLLVHFSARYISMFRPLTRVIIRLCYSGIRQILSSRIIREVGHAHDDRSSYINFFKVIILFNGLMPSLKVKLIKMSIFNIIISLIILKSCFLLRLLSALPG